MLVGSPWRCALLLRLERPHVRGLRALRALGHVELDGLALVQRAVAARLNGAEVHEDVLARLRLDKTIALVSVEPLDGANSHGCLSLPPSTRRSRSTSVRPSWRRRQRTSSTPNCESQTLNLCGPQRSR